MVETWGEAKRERLERLERLGRLGSLERTWHCGAAGYR